MRLSSLPLGNASIIIDLILRIVLFLILSYNLPLVISLHHPPKPEKEVIFLHTGLALFTCRKHCFLMYLKISVFFFSFLKFNAAFGYLKAVRNSVEKPHTGAHWWLFCLFCFVFSEAFMILWLKQESKYFDLCYPTQACGLSCSTIYSYLRQVLALLPIPAEWSISPQSFLYLGESYGQVWKDRWPRELEAAPQ